MTNEPSSSSSKMVVQHRTRTLTVIFSFALFMVVFDGFFHLLGKYAENIWITIQMPIIHSLRTVKIKHLEEEILNVVQLHQLAATYNGRDLAPLPSLSNCGEKPFVKIPNYTLSEMFAGPGVVNQTISNNSDFSVCTFQPGPYGYHFPHTMQRIYRCWSWWQINLEQEKVLEVPFKFSNNMEKNAFNNGFYQWLVRHGVRISQTGKETLALNQLFQSVRVTPVMFSGWDASERWFFKSPEDTQSMRDAVVSSLFPDRHTSECGTTVKSKDTEKHSGQKNVRIAILNRKHNRQLTNTTELVQQLQGLVEPKVTIEYFEEASFQEQVDFFSSTDILVSPHGAQLTGVPFMPRCGGVLELFPKNYWIPGYFGSLASVSGLTYSYLYLSDGDPEQETKRTRSNAKIRLKARHVEFFQTPVMRVVEEVQCLIEHWSYCCDKNSS